MSILDVEHHETGNASDCSNSIQFDTSESDSVSFYLYDPIDDGQPNSSYSSLQSQQTSNASRLGGRNTATGKKDILDYFGRNKREGDRKKWKDSSGNHEQAACSPSVSDCRSHRTGVTRRSRAPSRANSCPDGLHCLFQRNEVGSCRKPRVEDVTTIGSKEKSVQTWHQTAFQQLNRRKAGSFRRTRALRRTESVPNSIASRPRHHYRWEEKLESKIAELLSEEEKKLENYVHGITPSSENSLRSAGASRHSTARRSISDPNYSSRPFRGLSRAPGRSRSDPENLVDLARSLENLTGLEVSPSRKHEQDGADQRLLVTLEKQTRTRTLVRRRSRTTRRWKSSPNVVQDVSWELGNEIKYSLAKNEPSASTDNDGEPLKDPIQSGSEHFQQKAVDNLTHCRSQKTLERHHDILTGYSRNSEKHTSTMGSTKQPISGEAVNKNGGSGSFRMPSDRRQHRDFRRGLSRSKSDSHLSFANGDKSVGLEAKRDGNATWWQPKWIHGVLRSRRVASKTESPAD